MRRPRQIVAVFLLGLVVAAPWASAWDLRSESRGSSTQSGLGLLDRLGSFLTSLWDRAGCISDPLGGCASANEPSDAGCGIDPLGGCVDDRMPVNACDEGCGIDPLGGCRESR